MNVELEITHRCNLSCINCNRHCNIFPGEPDMTVEQVEQAVSEMPASVEHVRIIGGEPFLHPDLKQIAPIVSKAFDTEIISNGTYHVSDFCGVPVRTPVPVNRKMQTHICMFVAAKDTGQPWKPLCRVPQECGIARTARGWYPCGTGAAIDRLFCLGLVRSTPPLEYDGLVGHFPEIYEVCSLCANAMMVPLFEWGMGRPVSKSYERFFAAKGGVP